LSNQIGRDELKHCISCGSVLLKYVDFDTNKNSEICLNCNNIDIKDKSVVNASYLPFYSETGQPYTPVIKSIPKAETTTLDKLDIFYQSTGKPADNRTQRYYGKIEVNNKVIAAAIQEEIKPIAQGQQEIKPHIGKIIIDWSPVIGYTEIKHILDAIINNQSKKKTHTLIAGAPGTSKTVFLKTIEASLKKQNINVHYLDATTLSSSGVVQYLFDNNVQYCLLDELDKLEKEHQKVFLNLLESGILQETKSGIGKNKDERIRKKECKDIIVIATANYIERIMKPLKTRFLPLNIPAYTKQQFYDIGEQLLTQQYKKSKEIAYYIVDCVWNIYAIKQNKPPNLRQAVQVATLTDNTKQSIDPILQGLEKYSEEYEE
jgi:hypothetical protein